MIIIFLLYLSIIDIKTMYISTLKQLILLSIIIVIGKQYYFIYSIGLLIVFILISLKMKNKIGGADVKILVILSLYYGYQIFFIIIVSTLLAMVFILQQQKNKSPIPFVPFITLGVMYVEFFQFITSIYAT